MIVTFAHHKGGTGKTTATTSVAGAAALAGRRVLVVDLDPQANATAALGVATSSLKTTMLDVLTGDVPMREILVETDAVVHLAPASLDLVKAEPQLYARGTPGILAAKNAVAPLRDAYDLVLLDTPPGAGILMLNGLAAADEIIVTLDPGVFALEDINALAQILAELPPEVGRGPICERAVLSRAVRPDLIARLVGRTDPVATVLAHLRARFERVNVIAHDPELFRAQAEGMPIGHIAPQSTAARSYQSLTSELLP